MMKNESKKNTEPRVSQVQMHLENLITLCYNA